MMDAELIRSARALEGVDVLLNEPLSRHTSLGVGGPADLFVVPHSTDALCAVVNYAVEAQIPFFVLGEGTNVIVRDGGIRGMAVKLGQNLAVISRDGSLVTAQAGARLAMLCRKCCEWGLSGLEFAAGIPGSIGGALVMNAGAYDGEVGHVVDWVLAIDGDGHKRRLSRDELDMRYRHSTFQRNGMIIAEAGFLLRPDDPKAVRSRTYAVVEDRCCKQPVAQRSAGSIFRRPTGDYAGRLLDQAGAKGLEVGGAKISEKHANFIVNCNAATAAQILELIELARQRVHDQFDVWLESEVMVVGEDPQ